MFKNLFVAVLVAISVAGCGRRGGLVDPSPIGDTVELRDVSVNVPDGTVLQRGEYAEVTVRFESDLPDNEYVCIQTALSKERDVLSDGFSGKTVKTVGQWKSGNPHRLGVGPGQITRKETTFRYVHVVVFRGFGPGPGEMRPPIVIGTLGNILAREVIEREITTACQWVEGCS